MLLKVRIGRAASGADALQRAVPVPQHEVGMHCALRWRVVRQSLALASCRQHIEDAKYLCISRRFTDRLRPRCLAGGIIGPESPFRSDRWGKKGHYALLHAGAQAYTSGAPSRIKREGRATERGAISKRAHDPQCRRTQRSDRHCRSIPPAAARSSLYRPRCRLRQMSA